MRRPGRVTRRATGGKTVVPGRELGEAASAGEELLVRPDLDDVSAVEDDDLVGIANGREPVRDGDRRPTLGKALERLLDEPLGLRVEGRGRLVQHEDGRVPEDRARNRDPLLLASREAIAALADHGVVAVGRVAISSWICAARAASSISSSVAAGLAKRRFSRTVS